jgi:hypothetical protein
MPQICVESEAQTRMQRNSSINIDLLYLIGMNELTANIILFLYQLAIIYIVSCNKILYTNMF